MFQVRFLVTSSQSADDLPSSAVAVSYNSYSITTWGRGWIERTGYSRDTRRPYRLPTVTLNSLSRRSIMLQRNSLTPLLLPDKFSIKTLTSLIPRSSPPPPPPSPLLIVCPVCACVCLYIGCVDGVLCIRVRGYQCDLERTVIRQVSDNFYEQGNNRKLSTPRTQI